jgi:hypothetical protein
MATRTRVGGPGRNPKPADERKSKLVQFRLTEPEWDELVAAALAAGMTVREWLVMTTLKAARRARR